MRTLWLIVTLLIVVPVVELATLIAVGSVIGPGWTILAVLATSALGGALLRQEGRRAWQAVKDNVDAGRPPGRQATDGLLVVVGGILMLVPGFVSDLLGLLMIAPPTRPLFRKVVERAAVKRLSPQASGQLFGPRTVKMSTASAAGPDAPIEGEIV